MGNMLDSLDFAFSEYGKNIKDYLMYSLVLFLITIIVMAIAAAIGFATIIFSSAGAATAPTAMMYSLFSVIGVLVAVIAAIMIVLEFSYVASVNFNLKGNHFKLEHFLNFVKTKWKKYLGLGIVHLLIASPFIAAMFYFIFSISPENANPFLAFSQMIVYLLLLGLFIAIIELFLSFSFIILIVEDKGIIESLKASVHFVKSNFLSVLGLFIVLGLLAAALSLIPFALGIYFVYYPIAYISMITLYKKCTGKMMGKAVKPEPITSGETMQMQ